jgi:diguanylate cyclase (GGDEF)-like protein
MNRSARRRNPVERLAVEAWAWFLGAGLLATVVFLFLDGTDLQSTAYELIAGVAAAAVLVGVRFHQPARPAGWQLLAASGALWAVGALLWGANETVFDAASFPSLADAAYLAAYPLLVLGIVRLIHERAGKRDTGAVLDAIALAVAAAIPSAIFLVAPMLDDAALGPLAKQVAVAYPLVDLFLLAALVRLVLVPGRWSVSQRLLVAGLACNVTAGTIFAVPSVAVGHSGVGPLDGVWLLGYLLVAAAALHPTMTEVTEPSEPRADASVGRIAAVALAGISAPAVLAVEALTGEVHHLPVILAGWGVVLVLLVARLTVLTRWLAREAHIDPLTRLPNRHHLLDRVDAILRRGPDATEGIALLYLDLDRFKVVNDSIGRDAGDQLLIDVAERLRATVRPGDLVTRLRGDDFVVLCHDITDEASARVVAQRLTGGLADPFWVDGAPHFLSASMGISRATSWTGQAAELLHDANAALTRAKTGGRSGSAIYDPSMERELSLRGRFEHDLFDAMGKGELLLHYQPVLDLGTGTVAGVEALLRWQHPDWGLTRPDSILPIAEETGLIVPIGQWVVGEACEQLRRWHREDPATAPREITVNVARRELLDPSYIAHLAACLERSGLPAGALVLDVADDGLADAPTAVLEALNRVRGLGVHVCIDGFGMGRRSLANVRRVPADRLKIDRSLVALVADHPDDRVVLSSLLQLGASLGLQVSAAGVESRSQSTQLERMGCLQAQGNLWAPPLPPGSVLDEVLGRIPVQ